jgi:membrane protein YqaA with SNARE-associated domain
LPSCGSHVSWNFEWILNTITGLIAQYDYLAVFAAAFLEVIFPPIPSEVRSFHWWVLQPRAERLGLKTQLAWRPWVRSAQLQGQ